MPHSHTPPKRRTAAFALAVAMSFAGAAKAAEPPSAEGDVVLHDYRFGDGSTVASLRLHYLTLGTPRRDGSGQVINAALLLHGLGGTGRDFLAPAARRELFGPGKPLDAARYYVVMPDGIGAGSSSKPSDGMKARFPHYGTGDQVEAQRRLLEEGLGIHHLALVLGASMGGMQAWLWAERQPAFADGTVAIAATPAAVAGRDAMWRDVVAHAIRHDPDFHDGDYEAQPQHWRAVLPLFAVMGGDARHLGGEAPTREAAEDLDERLAAAGEAMDANDLLATIENAWDYDPSGELGRITGPFLSVNFADDLINPPELGLVDAAMARLGDGTTVLIPAGPDTYGNMTAAHPEVWGPAVARFVARLPRG